MLFYCVLVFFLSSSTALQRLLVTTKLGTVNGYHKTSYDGRTYSAFEGIPYAKPPVGKLRFEAPVKPDLWEKPLDVDKIYVCPQIDFIFQNATGSEDCLYINVYVPKEVPNPNDNLNVIVHIHGGAFNVGSSTMAGPLFFMDRDVIFVNFNYRLGVFGFLSTEDDVVPGNNGLKDQNLALKWVQDNIKQFGGNPESVTLTGASAGGSSVHFYYFSKMSKGLFHRGISQSGTALAPWAIQEGALERTKALAVLLSCKDTTTSRTCIECLKEKSSDEIVDQTVNLMSPAGDFPIAIFAPVVEKQSRSAFLDGYPDELLTRGDFNDLPWITSMCTEEGSIAIYTLYKELDTLNEKFNKFSHYYLDYNYTTCSADREAIADKIRKQYFGIDAIARDTYRNIIKLFGDRMFGFSLEKSARMQASLSKSKIYSYIYGYKESSSESFLKLMDIKDIDFDAGHADDSILLYDDRFFELEGTNFDLSKTDELIKDMMVDMYVSFVDSNVPKINDMALDPVNNSKEFSYLSIKSPTDIKMNVTEEVTPTEFWEKLPIFENGKISDKFCI